MKQSMLLSITFVNWMLCAAHSAPLGTAFTYQGRLNDNGNPANGIYDLRFTIYDSTNNPGTVVAGPLTNSATSVSNGLFTVMLDFGAGVFNGADRWIAIAARTNGGSAFTTLDPRQQTTPTPYALNAANLMSFAGQPLDIRAGGQRILRLDPNVNAPNIIGGAAGNFIASGVEGATIAGG